MTPLSTFGIINVSYISIPAYSYSAPNTTNLIPDPLFVCLKKMEVNKKNLILYPYSNTRRSNSGG